MLVLLIKEVVYNKGDMVIDELTKSQKLLYQIIKQTKDIDDKTKLAKLQYFADFVHYAFHDNPISEETNIYQKRKQGPLSKSFNYDLGRLEAHGLIKEKPKFHFSIKKDVDVDFSKEEQKTINFIVEKYSGNSFDELIKISHSQIPYISANDGGVIEYFTAYNLADDYREYEEYGK